MNEALHHLLEEIRTTRRKQKHLEALRSLTTEDKAEEEHNAQANASKRQELSGRDLSW